MKTDLIVKIISYVIAGIISVAFLVVIVTAIDYDDTRPEVLTVGEEIAVPDGYTFVDASAFGKIQSYPTYYCSNNETGRIYVCTDGVIGREIVIPDGYTFVGASAFGEIQSYPTYYCKQNSTGRVFICKTD